MKTCTKCGINKPLSEYYKRKKTVKCVVYYKCVARCKVCVIASQKKYRSKPENKEKIRAYKKEYRKEYISKPENKEKIRASQKKYRSKPENKEKIRADYKKYYSKPEIKEKKRAYSKEYRSNPENKEKRRAYVRNQRKTNPVFRIKLILRSRLSNALQGNAKSESTMKLLGCTGEQAVQWIESQFKDGMTWDNIDVDHMMPCSSFDLRSAEEQQKCFHYTNLQPLKKADNRRKSDHIVDDMKWSGCQWLIKSKNNLYRPRNLRINVYK